MLWFWLPLEFLLPALTPLTDDDPDTVALVLELTPLTDDDPDTVALVLELLLNIFLRDRAEL